MDTEHEDERWMAVERENGDIRARLRLLTPEEGGRQSPIASGYRAHWAFPPEIHDEPHDAPLTLEPRPEPGEWLHPGEEAIVRLHPLFPDLWPAVVPGMRLAMVEGARVVGVAEVVEAVPASA